MLSASESLRDIFIRRGFWLYLFTFCIAPTGYIVRMVLARTLPIDDLGLIYSVLSLITLLTAFNDFGFTESLVYYLPRCIAQRDWSGFKTILVYAMGVQLVSSVIIASMLFFGADWLGREYFHHPAGAIVLRICCLFFLGINFFQILTTVFRASQNTKLQKGSDFVRMLFVVFFVVTLAWTGTGTIETYMWAWIGGLAVGITLALFFFVRDYYRPYLAGVAIQPSRTHFLSVLGYAGSVLIMANISTLLSQVDMQMVGYFLGMRDAGYYANYLSIIGIPFLFLTPMIQFLTPVIAHADGGGATQRITSIKAFATRYLSIVGIMIGACMVVLGQSVAVILFGDDFRFSGIILLGSAPFIVFNILLQINMQILAGTGRVATRIRMLLVTFAVNVSLSCLALFILHIGTVGVSMAVGLAWIVLWAMSEQATRDVPAVWDYWAVGRAFIIYGVLDTILWITMPLWQ